VNELLSWGNAGNKQTRTKRAKEEPFLGKIFMGDALLKSNFVYDKVSLLSTNNRDWCRPFN